MRSLFNTAAARDVRRAFVLLLLALGAGAVDGLECRSAAAQVARPRKQPAVSAAAARLRKQETEASSADEDDADLGPVVTPLGDDPRPPVANKSSWYDLDGQGRMVPKDHARDLFTSTSLNGPVRRNWAANEVTWAASELNFQTPYFDEVPVERYGQVVDPNLQPWISCARFYGNIVVMPYKLCIDGTHDRIYTLGYYRPGSPMPALRQRMPWDPRAAANELATVIGFAVMLP